MHLQPGHLEPVPVLRTQHLGPKDYLAIVLRRRWIIMGIALPIIIAATIGTLRTTDFVTASARVMLVPRQPENPSFDRPNVDYTVLMSSAAQIATSIPVAEKAAAALMDSLPSLRAEAPALAGVRSRGQLRDVLLGGVDCNQVGESSILAIIFRHADASFALRAVGALTDAYLAYNVESQQNREAVTYYNEQIAAVEAEVDSLMRLRAAIRDKAGYTALAANASAAVGHLFALQDELAKLRSQREGIEAKLAGVLAAIAADPDYLPAFRTGQSTILVALKDRLDSAKAKLAELKVQYQDGSEWVLRQEQLVAAARHEFRRERDNYLEDLRIDLAEASQAETAYRQSVDAQKTILSDFPEIESRVEALDLRISMQRELAKSLQMKLGEVRMKAGSDHRISNILRLNEPAIESMVARGKKALYLGLACLFAVVLGLIGALFVDNQDHRLYDRHRLESALEVPVLASVSDSSLAKRGP